jgi:hypothetical protein
MATVKYKIRFFTGHFAGSMRSAQLSFPNKRIASSWIQNVQLRILPENYFESERFLGDFEISLCP